MQNGQPVTHFTSTSNSAIGSSEFRRAGSPPASTPPAPEHGRGHDQCPGPARLASASIGAMSSAGERGRNLHRPHRHRGPRAVIEREVDLVASDPGRIDRVLDPLAWI